MSDMRLRAGDSASHRGCSEPAEGTKTIDRAELEKAIKEARDYTFASWCNSNMLVVHAAEAWLATLPEPPRTKMVEVKRWVGFTYDEDSCLGIDGLLIVNLRAFQEEQNHTQGQWVTFKVEVPA